MNLFMRNLFSRTFVCMMELSRLPCLGMNRETLRRESKRTQLAPELSCGPVGVHCWWHASDVAGTRNWGAKRSCSDAWGVADPPFSFFFLCKMLLAIFNSLYSIWIFESDYQVSLLKVLFKFWLEVIDLIELNWQISLEKIAIFMMLCLSYSTKTYFHMFWSYFMCFNKVFLHWPLRMCKLLYIYFPKSVSFCCYSVFYLEYIYVF